MADVKITTLLAGLVLVGLIISVFGFFTAELSENYNITDNGSSLSKYNKLTQLQNISESVKEKEADLGQNTNVPDVLGLIFTNGYKALKASFTSIDLFVGITDDGTDDLNLGASGAMFKTAALTMIVIFIVIGVFIAAIVKRDL